MSWHTTDLDRQHLSAGGGAAATVPRDSATGRKYERPENVKLGWPRLMTRGDDSLPATSVTVGVSVMTRNIRIYSSPGCLHAGEKPINRHSPAQP